MTETNTSRSATESAPEPDQESVTETPESTETPETSATAPPADVTTPPAPDHDTQDGTPEIYATPVREPGIPEASPDGAWLAYLYPGENDTRELWLSPTDGAEAHRLDLPFSPFDDIDPDTHRQIRGPQWSPDGTTLALTGMHPDGDRSTVWLVSLNFEEMEDASATETVTATAAPADETVETAEDAATSEADSTDTDPTAEATEEASADSNGEAQTGDAEASASSEASESPTVAPAQVTTTRQIPSVGDTRLLADTPKPTRSPRWSPDGSLMLVVVTIDGIDQIGLAQPSLADLPPMIEPITSGPLPHREPIWSRDGRFTAFTRQIGSDWRYADICTFEPQTGEFKNLTGEKDPNIRHTLDWVPGRNLVSFVTRDGDWLGIAVVNADNRAGWMVTRENGDKWGSRFAPDEPRVAYIRSEGFSTVLVERGLHGSNSVALDPGEGVVTKPVWSAAKKVAYGFSAPQKPLGWFVQETNSEAERTVISMPETVRANRVTLRHPAPFEFDVGPEEVFSGLLYQSDGVAGPVPGVVYVPDGPLTARLAAFQREEQALASSGAAILVPVMHGASGFGTAVEDDLAEYGDDELEAADLAAAGEALAARDTVDASKLALVGHGYGGTLAMIAAGARPGVYGTVVAIDPIIDWTIELDQADRVWRQWVTRQYGLPLTNADRYALRTPETFAGVIDGDLLLVSTSGASEIRQSQMQLFRAWLEHTGITHTHIEIDASTPAAALYEAGGRLAERLRTTG